MGIDTDEKIVYQIYPMSFYDSDNDGTGDIPGIISRLDYIESLGVNCIWLSPVYKSPGYDNGYDISDYKEINPVFGTMEDMENLISRAKAKGIGILMDLVINHTSDEHEWFRKSRHKNSPYRDYYFWRKGKNFGPPNNWSSFFGGKAWKKDELSGEYYLHLFSEKQPDLNFKNPKVLNEIKDVMKFWLDKGIEGFRCDVINVIWKTSLANGRKRFILTGREHYLSQEGMHEILRTLHSEVLDHYKCFTVGETVFITPKDANELCCGEKSELDTVFSFEHMECDSVLVKWFKKRFKPKSLYKALSKWQEKFPKNAVYFENHDQPRSVSRFIKNPKYRVQGAKVLAMILLSLKGTPYIYQGQEIGMTNFDMDTLEQIRDVESHNIYKLARKLRFSKKHAWKLIVRTGRDNARTPMQWELENNAGFTKGVPWIKVNENYRGINVKDQESDEDSILSFYKEMINLRKTNFILTKGKYRKIKITRSLFVYERYMDDNDGKPLRIVVNLSSRKAYHDFAGEVLLCTSDRKEYTGHIDPYEGFVLTR